MVKDHSLVIYRAFVYPSSVKEAGTNEKAFHGKRTKRMYTVLFVSLCADCFLIDFCFFGKGSTVYMKFTTPV
jgi:hypothetical protein